MNKSRMVAAVDRADIRAANAIALARECYKAGCWGSGDVAAREARILLRECRRLTERAQRLHTRKIQGQASPVALVSVNRQEPTSFADRGAK